MEESFLCGGEKFNSFWWCKPIPEMKVEETFCGFSLSEMEKFSVDFSTC